MYNSVAVKNRVKIAQFTLNTSQNCITLFLNIIVHVAADVKIASHLYSLLCAV